MKKDYVHLCIVLDASGSMASIEDDIKGSLNTFMATQKNTPEQTVFDVFQFSDTVKRIVAHADMTNYEGNLMNSYQCSGCTALHDAICIAIDTIGKEFAEMPEEERPESVIVAIVTDGYENASKKYTLRDVKKRIDHQTNKYNWEFVYLAANQDDFEAEHISLSMGVTQRRNSMYQADLSTIAREAIGESLTQARTRNREKRSGK